MYRVFTCFALKHLESVDECEVNDQTNPHAKAPKSPRHVQKPDGGVDL